MCALVFLVLTLLRIKQVGAENGRCGKLRHRGGMSQMNRSDRVGVQHVLLVLS